MTTKARELMSSNFDILTKFFKRYASGLILNGNLHRLHLNIDAEEMFCTEEFNEHTYIVVDSISEIYRIRGYSGKVNTEFLLMSDRELREHGFAEWLNEIKQNIEFVLNNQ
jgi:hypothetical protein